MSVRDPRVTLKQLVDFIDEARLMLVELE